MCPEYSRVTNLIDEMGWSLTVRVQVYHLCEFKGHTAHVAHNFSPHPFVLAFVQAWCALAFLRPGGKLQLGKGVSTA